MMVPAPGTSLVHPHHNRVKPAQVFPVPSCCLWVWDYSVLQTHLHTQIPPPKPLLSAGSLPVIREVFRAAKDLKHLVWVTYGDN